MYWVLAIIMFGAIITLHELGHFWAARLTGVKVVEFAVGFGPKLLSHRAKSGVRYSLRALPLGGYCRFLDEDEYVDEAGEVQRAEEDDTSREPNPDAMSKAKIWKRAVISLSGPLMNVITAFVLLFVLFFIIGLQAGIEPVVDVLLPDMPAEAAGLLPGDRILRVNGVEIESAEQASQQITEAGGEEIIFTMERDGQPVEIALTPEWVEEDGAEPRYMIGIQYRLGSERVQLSFGESVQSSFVMTGEMARIVVDALKGLFTAQTSMDELSGPIGTVTIIKEETERGGIANYLYLAAAISVNVGLFNLLPVPGLDGSKLLFLLIEKLRGKPLSRNKEGIVTLVGFALLMGLMVVTMYQDIARLLQ